MLAAILVAVTKRTPMEVFLVVEGFQKGTPLYFLLCFLHSTPISKISAPFTLHRRSSFLPKAIFWAVKYKFHWAEFSQCYLKYHAWCLKEGMNALVPPPPSNQRNFKKHPNPPVTCVNPSSWSVSKHRVSGTTISGALLIRSFSWRQAYTEITAVSWLWPKSVSFWRLKFWLNVRLCTAAELHIGCD